MRFVVLLLLLVACDPPDPNLVLNCQKACSPAMVRSWTWDGYHHSATCECDREPK